jgi:hypothetical protein
MIFGVAAGPRTAAKICGPYFHVMVNKLTTEK